MAYQTGTSTGIADLLSQLCTFLTANGFTCSATWTSSTNTVGAINKGSDYWIYQYTTLSPTEIILSTATGSTGSGALSAQPGVPSLRCYVNNIGGAFVDYHFFTDGTRVNVAIQKVAGVWSHINFGVLAKVGSWSGGAYVTGLYTDQSSSSSRADVLTQSTNSVPFGPVFATTVSTSAASGRRGHVRTSTAVAGVALLGQQPGTSTYSTYHMAMGFEWAYGAEVLYATPNIYNGRAVLAPITIGLMQSNTDAQNINVVGYVPNVAVVNIKDLNAADTVNTDWMVFPLSQKNGDAATYVNSKNYGIAYQK